ncbi:NAD(P)/FAD-dependent oxidoreductase [Pseudonocardia broussonetiae]|uniref:FAD-dependent oxidoreductase n=1 Tax=Pseudonocardia broussonetiae TaxID=2736640 RepID=A0A6M6JM15_9PSEU|nr:FAD-dependent oxidoreductase [Pseudonocardia broussonetiae]QJY48120.1 FAD-dependent oxidoreductase [Pseudonocardia broussonetiae]
MAPLDRIVVVGAGAAGLTALETLREAGFRGHVTLLGAEPHPPYDRPPLSKRVLLGEQGPDDVHLRPPARFDDLQADVVLADPAVGLDRARREVVGASGRVLPFDGLVVATGVDARRVPGPAPVHHLRTLDDALALREQLRHRPRTVVVGAGPLGLEVAAAARQRGCEVTVVDPGDAPMRRQLGAVVGRLLRARHERAGIVFRTGAGTGVVGVEPRGPGLAAVRLTDGTVLDAGLVVGAIGAEPAHGWLAGTGLTHPVGVPCDRRCLAADGIAVAGDVAAQRDPLSPHGFRRVEHRLNASEQGRCAALNLLGHGEDLVSSGYSWSDQGDLRLQAVGVFPEHGRTVVVEGDPAQDRFVAVGVADRTVVGVVAWNSARSFTRWRGRTGLPAEDVLAVAS